METSTSNLSKRSIWNKIYLILYYLFHTWRIFSIFFYSCRSISYRFSVPSRRSSYERRDVARCHLKMSLETRGGSGRRCERVSLTTTSTTATATMTTTAKTACTTSAYRGRLRSLKEWTKWCKSSSVARMHARCNALATDLEIVSSTPTRWRRPRRASLCHARDN